MTAGFNVMLIFQGVDSRFIILLSDLDFVGRREGFKMKRLESNTHPENQNGRQNTQASRKKEEDGLITDLARQKPNEQPEILRFRYLISGHQKSYPCRH